jgi:divalent metal cation (Fe/Co/Zn/Cd) transporter
MYKISFVLRFFENEVVKGSQVTYSYSIETDKVMPAHEITEFIKQLEQSIKKHNKAYKLISVDTDIKILKS